MKYKAVIFDLFGTLVDIFSRSERERVLNEMSSALSIPADEFSRLWNAGDDARTLGKVSSPVVMLEEICRHLAITPTQEKLDLASKARIDYYSRNLKPRPEAVPTLTKLKNQGCRIGLISNCATEIYSSWQYSPFASLIETPVFSCAVGFKKPDPHIYTIALTKLGVNPGDCLYVADGDSGELKGAIDAGMNSVRIRYPYEKKSDALRVSEENWNGPSISSLKEVLDLLL